MANCVLTIELYAEILESGTDITLGNAMIEFIVCLSVSLRSIRMNHIAVIR